MRKILTTILLLVSIYASSQTVYEDGSMGLKKINEEKITFYDHANYGSDASIAIKNDIYIISFNDEKGTSVTYTLTHHKGDKYRDKNKVVYTLDDNLELNGILILTLAETEYTKYQTNIMFFYGFHKK